VGHSVEKQGVNKINLHIRSEFDGTPIGWEINDEKIENTYSTTCHVFLYMI